MFVKPPVTQREVAEVCGLHPSTICLALNGSPSIPVETRLRVQKAAHDLGYRPNAAARNLAAMRTERRPAGRLPLGWINQEASAGFWQTNPGARRIFESARQQAEENGYYLDEIWTRSAGMNVRRIAQILQARGIDGVMFPVYRSIDPSIFSLVWNEFSTVGLGDHRLGEWFDLVCPDYCHNIDLILAELPKQKFGRIGLVLSPTDDEMTRGLLRSRYLTFQAGRNAVAPLPIFQCVGTEPDRLKQWYADHRPEVVICRDEILSKWIDDHLRRPQTVQWDALPGARWPGIDSRSSQMAIRGVECLLRKMQRFERGIGEGTECHTVKGVWRNAQVLTSQAVA